MASTTIHTLAYKIVADSSKFKSEMAKTNAEIKGGKQLTEQYSSTLSKHQKEMDALGILYKKGRIDVATYTKAMNAQDKAMFQASKTGKAWSVTLGLIKAGTVAAVAAGTAFAKSSVAMIGPLEQMDRAARRMGITFQELDMLTRGGRMLDISEQEMVGAMQNLMQVVSMADAGNKKAAKSLGLLGLSAKELKGLAADQLLGRVAEAISEIDDANRRVDLTNRLLGDAGQQLSDVLAGGSVAVANMVAEARAIGPSLTESQIASIRAADAEMDKFQETWRQIKVDFATTVSGPLGDYLATILNAQARGDEPVSALAHFYEASAVEGDQKQQLAGPRKRGQTPRAAGLAEQRRQEEATRRFGAANRRRRDAAIGIATDIREGLFVHRGTPNPSPVVHSPRQQEIDSLMQRRTELEGRRGGILFEGDRQYRDATLRELKTLNAQVLELLKQQQREVRTPALNN